MVPRFDHWYVKRGLHPGQYGAMIMVLALQLIAGSRQPSHSVSGGGGRLCLPVAVVPHLC